MDGFGTITWWGFTPSLDMQDIGLIIGYYVESTEIQSVLAV